MAANDPITGGIQVLRQTRANARAVLLGEIHTSALDETTPDKQLYVNGGAPVGAGQRRATPGKPAGVLHEGEYLVIQVKPAATKTLDSVGSTGGVLRVGIIAHDLNTGSSVPRMLTEGDRNTSLVPDDASKTSAVWNDAYAFQVPSGERWQLFGEFTVDLRTTA